MFTIEQQTNLISLKVIILQSFSIHPDVGELLYNYPYKKKFLKDRKYHKVNNACVLK